MLRSVAAALSLAVLGCPAERAAQRETAVVRDSVLQSPPYRILFIGNSLTYMHDMPQLFAGLARAGGVAVVVEQYAPGGARLRGHAEDPAVRALLERGGWWAVVLQEQSQLPALHDDQVRRDMEPYATRLARMARAASPGTRVVLYQTPAAQNGDRQNAREIPEVGTYEGMQRRINATYRRVAGELGATLVPAGEAWQLARRERPDIVLYEDEIHPGREGAYLVACVFYAVLFERDPTGLEFTGGVDRTVAAALQGFAWRTRGR